MMTVIGIDSAKNRVDAVAFHEEEIVSSYTMDLSNHRKLDRGETIRALYQGIWSWIREDLARYWPPVLYIEEPIMVRNIRVAIELAETVGMLLTLPYPSYLVPIDSWKKELAKAGLSKEEVRSIISGRFPATQSFGDRQDLFDATGVAVYGLTDQLLRRGLGSESSSNPLGGGLA